MEPIAAVGDGRQRPQRRGHDALRPDRRLAIRRTIRPARAGWPGGGRAGQAANRADRTDVVRQLVAAALGEPRRHLEVALLSLGGLLQYFVFIYLWVIGVFPPGESVGVQSAAYLAIIGPLVVGLLVRSAPPLRGQFTIPIRSYPSSGE